MLLLFALPVTSKCAQSNDKVFLIYAQICREIYIFLPIPCVGTDDLSFHGAWVSGKKLLVFGWFSSLNQNSVVREAGTGEGKGACSGVSHWTGLAVTSDCSLC